MQLPLPLPLPWYTLDDDDFRFTYRNSHRAHRCIERHVIAFPGRAPALPKPPSNPLVVALYAMKTA